MVLAFTKSRLTGFNKVSLLQCLRYFLFGLLLPLGFAPFHLPGMAVIGLALFYYHLSSEQCLSPFLNGIFFGLGFFGLGTSWIYISIHEYGHLHGTIAAFITLIFLLYLSFFPAAMAWVFRYLNFKPYSIYSGLLFSALWVGSEYCRASFLTGFPWLLIGFGQFDAPSKYLLPIIGIFGLSFITVLAASLLSNGFKLQEKNRYWSLIAFVYVILSPLLLKSTKWVDIKEDAVSVAVVQANLSMRDKWDEKLFWKLLNQYGRHTKKLLGTQLIVLPESAIPLPANYVLDFLENLREGARKAGSAILLGIPQATTVDENYYFNTLTTLGKAKGSYIKQHLVPFGEYIPELFQRASNWLGVPEANLRPGRKRQTLIKVHHHPIATLICYELAYANLLRQQLPEAEWIVSISDDGWFGHSLAMYQHQQMAQVLSLETARYQVVANNDGLSSLIDTQGKIISALPAYRDGILKASLFPASGSTPWVILGDLPILLLCMIIIGIYTLYRGILLKVSKQPIAANHKRRYPYQPY